MPLTSIYYLLFVGVSVILFYLVKDKYKAALLIIFSYAFYMINQSYFVVILLVSTGLNYQLSSMMRTYRKLIYPIIVFNVGLLAFFKYLPVTVLSFLPNQGSIFWSSIVLPVGISFFTFQAIGYSLDIYWKGNKKHVSFRDFALYMSFFPQIMAGPIARSEAFIPQIKAPKVLQEINIVYGLRRILWGLFKKIVIADNLKQYVDAVFDNSTMHSGLTIILATTLYAVQLYCDFSGYSDIAIGSARLFGFKLMENFKVPLLSKSVVEFWRRWHISLSSWVRDYVNYPLQYRYRKLKSVGVVIAVFITFFIIGVWHGPKWNYLIFGLIMGLAITFEMFTKEWREKLWAHFPQWFSNVISTVLVFSFFSFCSIFLRADSLKVVAVLLSGASFSLHGFYFGSTSVMINAGTGLVVCAITEFRLKSVSFDEFLSGKNTFIRWTYYVGCTIAILSIGVLDSGSFIYFQF